MLSEYRERAECRCHVWWKTYRSWRRNWKSPFADDGEVERRNCKLARASRRESLPSHVVSHTGIDCQCQWVSECQRPNSDSVTVTVPDVVCLYFVVSANARREYGLLFSLSLGKSTCANHI